MICKVCQDKGQKGEIQAPFSRTTNLNKHLKHHENLKKWLKQYQDYSGNSVSTQLSVQEFDLICYFITTNTCLVDLKNAYLRNLLKYEVPSIKKFKENIEKVMEKLYTAIDKKVIVLQNSMNLKN